MAHADPSSTARPSVKSINRIWWISQQKGCESINRFLGGGGTVARDVHAVSVYSRMGLGVYVGGLRHDEAGGGGAVGGGRGRLRAGRREQQSRVHARSGRTSARQPQA